MKRAPRSLQHHDLYRKYHGHDSEISDLLGECGIRVGPPFMHAVQDAGTPLRHSLCNTLLTAVLDEDRSLFE